MKNRECCAPLEFFIFKPTKNQHSSALVCSRSFTAICIIFKATMVFELLLIFLALVVAWNYSGKRDQNFPPGPKRLPFLGHLPLMGRFPHKTLCQWRKTYGPIIGVWFGSYKTVVIHETKLIREALNMNTFAGRPRLNFFRGKSVDGCVRGIIFTDGQHWIQQRRFTLRNLRDFGYGTRTMEDKIQDEVNDFMERVKEKVGEPIQVKYIFNTAVINALWSIMFGERIIHEDPESQIGIRSVVELADEASLVGSLAVFIPWIAKIAPRLSGFEKMVRGFPPMRHFLGKQVQSHNILYVENQPRDFIDAYMDEVKKTTDPESSFHEKQGVLVDTLMDLFIGTIESTSTTLAWLLAYLIHYKKVQQKLQDEIDHVVGKERHPSLTDRSSMPYTEAVIHEVLRFSSMAPFSNFHAATEDVNFHGFFIPKDTLIIPNLYGAHFDEAVWGDPENFRPERFIDENGKFKKNENLLAFSTGKRVCPGEGLARDELFLFAANIFQTFTVTAAGKLPDLEPHVGFTLSAKPFEVNFMKRNEKHVH